MCMYYCGMYHLEYLHSFTCVPRCSPSDCIIIRDHSSHQYHRRMTQLHIAYYVTGHGFGHATRSLGLIANFLKSGYCVDIITSMKSEFFISSLDSSLTKEKLNVIRRNLDAGASQTNALTMDLSKTLENYYESVHTKYQLLLDIELDYLGMNRPNAVLVDATALVCTAAKEVGIPCIIVSNFTWEFIYKKMHADYVYNDEHTKQKFIDMIERCTADYCNASHYLQLPGCCEIPNGYPEERVLISPLMCRLAKCTRDGMRLKYNIPVHAKVVVFGFGGQSFMGYNLGADTLPVGQDWYCLVLGGEQYTDFGSNKFIPIHRDVYVPDILVGADVMLGKIGYGTVSECLSSLIPLIYVSRDGWPEERPLVQLMEKYCSIVEMPRLQFEEGKWATYLEHAIALKEKMPVDKMENELQYDSAIDTIQSKIEEIVASNSCIDSSNGG